MRAWTGAGIWQALAVLSPLLLPDHVEPVARRVMLAQVGATPPSPHSTTSGVVTPGVVTLIHTLNHVRRSSLLAAGLAREDVGCYDEE
jgi:hypothetical protein